MESNYVYIVEIMKELNGLPFKITDNENNNIIFVKTHDKLELIIVKDDTIRITLPYGDNNALNIENLARALNGLGIYIDNLDIHSLVEEQLYRELRFFSITVSEHTKEMSLKYQRGYRSILDNIFNLSLV